MIKIKIIDSTKETYYYLIKNNIYYEKLSIIEDGYILKIEENELKKFNNKFDIEILEYYGKNKIKRIIINNIYLIISIIISFILLYDLENCIFEVKINSNNEKIYNILNKELIKNNIIKYKHKKSKKEINQIKESILKNNNEIIDWIEIKENGCTYEIYVNEKNKEIKEIEKKQSIIAKREGQIKNIIVAKGTKLREVNDYVRQGEVIISPYVYKNDEIEYLDNAMGTIFAETWYTVKINIPFEYTEYEYTGKKIDSYYIKISNIKIILTGNYNSNMVQTKETLLLNKPYLLFKLYKEEKKIYNYKQYKINEKEAYKIGIEKARESISKALLDNEYIISKKVLKKEVNSSKMYIEVFFKVYENIGVTSNINNLGVNNE